MLAESADDARARAEADIRRGGEFESIEDSWPAEIVSVEAVARGVPSPGSPPDPTAAVEPYPDLE